MREGSGWGQSSEARQLDRPKRFLRATRNPSKAYLLRRFCLGAAPCGCRTDDDLPTRISQRTGRGLPVRRFFGSAAAGRHPLGG